MIESRLWLARDGWRVEITDGPRRLAFGPYTDKRDAAHVAARLVRQLTREGTTSAAAGSRDE